MKIHLNQTKYFAYTRKKLEPKIPPRFEFIVFIIIWFTYSKEEIPSLRHD